MTLTTDRIAEGLLAATGVRITAAEIKPAPATTGRSEVADETLKFFVTLGSRKCFLIISGGANHALVSRAVANIAQARALSGSASFAIIPPVLTGDIDGRSFAVWECHKPFPNGMISGKLFRYFYGTEILDWGLSLCKNSVRPCNNVERQYVLPLLQISNDLSWPVEMRSDAAVGLARIGEWMPLQCVQHGDFWSGNVMRSKEGGLAVVDWASSTVDGYPAFDMVRMLISLRATSRTRTRYMKSLCDILSCEPHDLASYSLAAIGNLGMHLEHFPVEQYRKMGIEVHRYSTQA